MNRMNSSLLGVFFSMIVVALLSSAPKAGAVDALLLQDTYVDSTSNKTAINYGTSADLRVFKSSTATMRAFLKFSLATLPAGTTSADIKQARLRLWVNSSTTALGSITMTPVTSAWSESTLTNNSSASLTYVLPIPDLSVGVTGNFISIDITGFVTNWVAGTFPNEGFVIQPSSTSTSLNLYFDSKESTVTSHEPQLDIVLNSPAGPAGSPGPQGPTGPQGLTGPAGPTGPQGATGPQGDVGPAGITGAQGPRGADGHSLLNGNRKPVASIGADGDFFVLNCTAYFGPTISFRGVTLTWDEQNLAYNNYLTETTDGFEIYSGQLSDSWASSHGLTLPNAWFISIYNLTTHQYGAWDFSVSPDGLFSFLDDVPNAAMTAPVQADFRDVYYVTANPPARPMFLYGPKAGGMWGLGSAVVGNRGAPGPQGPTGASGPQGPQGIQGPIGTAGATGPAGPPGPQGPAGAPGPQGLQGQTGSQGVPGTPGPAFTNGESIPLSGGVDGDYFLVPSNGELYQKIAGVWTSLLRIKGTSLLHGTSDPVNGTEETSGDGNAGDFYINTSTHMLFGPKNPPFWGAGVPLVGPVGSQGPKGDPGDPGTPGATGPQGPAGPIGLTGAQGPAGPTGEPGLAGPAGPAGPLGPQGLAGVEGPAGSPGSTWRSGGGAPSDTPTARVGDYYLDLSANDLYAWLPYPRTFYVDTFVGPFNNPFQLNHDDEYAATHPGRRSWHDATETYYVEHYDAEDVNFPEAILVANYNVNNWWYYQWLNGAWTLNETWSFYDRPAPDWQSAFFAHGGYYLVTNMRGEVGPEGPVGQTGPPGANGVAGSKGDPGDPGAIGPQGPAGLIGLTGAQGPVGSPGADGAPGPAGPQGIQGLPGSWPERLEPHGDLSMGEFTQGPTP
jgi:hypothetical protein